MTVVRGLHGAWAVLFAALVIGCATGSGPQGGGGKESGGPAKKGPDQKNGAGKQASGSAQYRWPILPERLRPMGAVRRHYMKSARVRINVQIDKKILDQPGEIWLHITRDEGKTWEVPRLVSIVDQSFRINFSKNEEDSGEGRFGVRLAKSVEKPKRLPAGTKPHRYIIVDRTPPTLRFNLPPEKILGGADDAGPAFSWTARDNTRDDLEIYLDYSSDDGESWKPINPVKNGKIMPIPHHQGVYRWAMPAVHKKGVRFRCRAVDPAGNEASSAPRETRTLDGIPPTVEVLGGPPKILIKDQAVSLPFDARKVGPSKLARIEAWVQADGGEWKMHKSLPLTSPAKVRFDGDGTYGVVLVAYDESRNHSPIPVGPAKPARTVVVDRTPPELVFTADFKPERYYRQGESITLAWQASDPNLLPAPVQLFYRTEDGRLVQIGGRRKPKGKINWELPNFSGKLTLVGIAKDQVGNQTERTWPSSDKPGKVKVLNTWAWAEIKDVRPSQDKQRIVIDYAVRDLAVAPLVKVELYWRSGAVRDWILSRENFTTPTGSFRLRAPPGIYDFYVRAITNIRSEAVPNRTTKPKLEGFRFNPRVPTLQLVDFPGRKRGEVYVGGKVVSIKWKAPDSGPDVEYTIEFFDGQAWKRIKENIQGKTQISWKLPVITAAQCKLRFQLADRMHGRATYTIPGDFGIDSSPPQTKNVIAPRLIRDGNLKLRVVVADNGPAGVGRVRMWYQSAPGKPWVAAGSHKVGTDFRSEVVYQLALKNEGTYRFHMTAEDKVGNAEMPPKPSQTPHCVVALDLTPPKVTLSDTFGGLAYRVGDSVKFTWQSEEAHPSANGTTLLYSTDQGTSWVAFAQEQPASGSYNWKIPDVIDGLKVQLQVQVRDRAGNIGKGQLGRPIQIGSKTLQVAVVGPMRSATSTVNLVYKSISVDPRAKISWIRLWITADGVNWTKGPRVDNPVSPLEVKLPPSGRFGIIVQAADSLRNEEPPPVRGSQAEITIEVDSTPPIVRLLGFGQQDVYHGGDSYTIRWEKLIDNNVGGTPLTLMYQKHPQTNWVEIASGQPDTQAYVWKMPGSGKYRIKLVGRDEMGNQAEAISQRWLIASTKAPTVTIVGPNKVMRSQRSVIVRFQVTSELDLPIEKVSLYWTLDEGKTWNQKTTFRISGEDVTRYKDGSYGLRYEGQDGANGVFLVAYDRPGNHNPRPVSGTKPMATYVVDSKPPALTIENTLGGKVFGPGEQVSIAWRVREGNLAPNPITIRMSSDAGYKWPITIAEGIANSGRHSFSLPSKPPASGRYYRVKIEVKDKVGHIGHAVSELFTIDAKPPTTRFLNVPKHLSKSPIALGVGVADQDGAGVAQVEVFQVKLDSGGRPVGKWSKRTISPWEGQNQVTFNLRDGYWGLLLVATDKKGNRQAVRGGDAQRMPTASTPPQERIQVHVQGPGVNLLTLAGGQTISGDKTQAIRWRTEQTSVPVTRVVISVSYDGGRTYAAIPGAETLQNTGRFEWKPPAGKDYPETRVRVEVFNRYGQRGMAASARNIYIDNGKPDVSGIEIEEDDEPRENDPEVKGWFKRQEDDRQPIILKPDPPKINPEDLSKKSVPDLSKKSVPDLSKKTVPVLSKKNMPASPKTNTENLSRLVGNAAQHYIDGSHRAAEQAMLAALQLRDNWGRGHYLLARICQQQGKPADVVRRLLQKATAFDSTLAEAYNDIGLIHYKQGQHTRAEAYFHRAIKARPLANAPRNKARFHYNLGLALWRQSKSRPAFAAFRDAVQFDPNFREAWFYVALLGDELGKQLVARDALARVVSLYPGTSDFHVWAKSKLR